MTALELNPEEYFIEEEPYYEPLGDEISTFEVAYKNGLPILLKGPTGCGKTRFIEHMAWRLKRPLITLSDGKPDDIDHYRGEYGIEDTRKALIEAKYSGIHPFCITIDEHAHDYLPHMYGAVNYTVVDDVAKLPVKVADIYRKLTT